MERIEIVQLQPPLSGTHLARYVADFTKTLSNEKRDDLELHALVDQFRDSPILLGADSHIHERRRQTSQRAEIVKME